MSNSFGSRARHRIVTLDIKSKILARKKLINQTSSNLLFERPKGNERTSYRLAENICKTHVQQRISILNMQRTQNSKVKKQKAKIQ